MRILGISAFYHDSAAALIEDGRIVAAAQEERFTRKKHDASFPVNAIKYCLDQRKKSPDVVVFYEKPLLKFERILRTFFDVAPHGFKAFVSAIPDWTQRKLWTPLIIENELKKLGYDAEGKICFIPHHQSHAASAFFPSPYESASVMTVDGVGEWSTVSLGYGNKNELKILKELKYPHSLGLLYSAFTYFCGFRVNSGEYKLMGLAPYGSPIYKDQILEHIVQLHEDGSFELNMDYFGFLKGDRMTSRAFDRLFYGSPRKPESEITQRECDLASSIQFVTEKVVQKMAEHLFSLTENRNLCMAGGVALNCVSNAQLLENSLFDNIWVQPASGDAGGALGAAFSYWFQYLEEDRNSDGEHDLMQGASLGPEFDDTEIESMLVSEGIPFTKPESIQKEIAEAVSTGNVVGVFQGRCEFGPRALGNRSILADARDLGMQKKLNLKIKYRESFRPFAPIVLEEKASDYFEIQQSSPYMLFTTKVRNRKCVQETRGIQDQLQQCRSDIPAVTHVDYSARLQTVNKEEHAGLHRILCEFEKLTGCAVMINTSFNVRGEPPVCSPVNALNCFLRTDMDFLSLGPFWIDKKQLNSDKWNLVSKGAMGLD